MRHAAVCLALAACAFPVPETTRCDSDAACPAGETCSADLRCVPEPAPCMKGLTSGDNHACALRDDGTVWCWGGNESGQLGDGSTETRDSPVQVMASVTFTAISAGSRHSCALASDGSMWCWGSNALLGSDANNTLPLRIENVGVTALASGDGHSCGRLEDGRVKCWRDARPFVEREDGSALSGVDEIAAGGPATCAVAGGVMSCWSGTEPAVGVAMPAGAGPVVHAAAGEDFQCALSDAGAVYCRGTSPGGAPDPMVQIPVPVPARAIAAGAFFACAITGTDRDLQNLWCWGADGHGQLADDLYVSHPNPVRTAYTRVVAAAGGELHLCALSSGGSVRCSGANSVGQLGDGYATLRTVPGEPIADLAGVAQLAAGESHTCALAGGAVLCWGGNASGQLGDGTPLGRYGPVAVSGVDGAIGVVSGAEHSCALLGPDGRAMCWGTNSFGELGNGVLLGVNQSSISAAQLVVGADHAPLRGIAQLAAGLSHTCARFADGRVQCWGHNKFGQVGDGTSFNDVAVPATVQLAPGAIAREIAVGSDHSCALLDDGSVVCWGANFVGQLGNADSAGAAQAVPVAVANLSGVTRISSRYNTTCALGAGRTVSCWGQGDKGQIGDNDALNRNFPVTMVNGVTTASQIAVGGFHACALTESGLRCWGSNDAGQLGDHSFQTRNSPVLVEIGQRKVAGISAGGRHTCAWFDDGTAGCWGLGESGQLGDGAYEKKGRVTPALTCP